MSNQPATTDPSSPSPKDTPMPEKTETSQTEAVSRLAPDSNSKNDTSPTPSKTSFFKKHGKKILIASLVIVLPLILLAVAGGVIGFHTYTVAMELKNKVDETEVVAREAYTSFKNQDLPGTQAKILEVETKMGEVRDIYTKLGFYNSVPVARSYYQDGIHGLNAADAGLSAGKKTVDAIVPYSDVLGFSGEGSFTGGTAEERVRLILETLAKVTPILDEISADVEVMNNELAMIDANRYPEQFRGIAVRSQLQEGKTLASSAGEALQEYRPVIELLPSLAGGTGERRKYLVLFQNDNELRPTGGFLTAYATIFVENGKVTPEKSDDIYKLDQKFNKRIPIPESLGRYLTTERFFNLRDMNISPDFKESMDLFLEHYQDVPGEPQDIDGIIAVDTHVLTSLLKAVGPVEVPGYGTFSAEDDPRCDCPEIIYILSEIITRPTPYLREDRKGILGPLMKAILEKIYSSPRTYMADMFTVGIESIEGRHLQVYMLDEESQAAMETINAAGRLDRQEGVQDFFAVVNANLGGAKSNLFVEYEMLQEVSAPQDGKITKTVEITYKNPRAGDNCNLEAGLLCLNSTLRDWTRIYLPEGSELIEAQGFNETPKEYQEDGFQVVDGFFILEPKGQAKLILTYTVPYTADTYQVEIWKQGGVDPIRTVMDVTGGQEEIIVNTDTVYEAEF